MGILRFPNPGSDINRFISTFSKIYNELKGKENFTHDDTRDAAIKHGLVSSSGAIGKEAVKRSVREDRSLDPLYNQLKMYSELYRMLGWLRPGTMNTNFNFTELSPYVSESQEQIQKRIFEECLISIVFPNPLVENKSGNNVRPFRLILLLSQLLRGVIFRDEIIMSIYPLQSDRDNQTIKNLAVSIKKVRGSSKALFAAKQKVSADSEIMETTLENYTRFPLGSLKGTGWYESQTVRGVYDKAITGYCLSKSGDEKANQMKALIDVRHEDIEEFSLEIRGAFALLTHYSFLGKCGFDNSSYQKLFDQLTNIIDPLMRKLSANDVKEIFYSPIQQSTLEEIDFANELDAKFVL